LSCSWNIASLFERSVEFGNNIEALLPLYWACSHYPVEVSKPGGEMQERGWHSSTQHCGSIELGQYFPQVILAIKR
jgi:hypothetical protein